MGGSPPPQKHQNTSGCHSTMTLKSKMFPVFSYREETEMHPGNRSLIRRRNSGEPEVTIGTGMRCGRGKEELRALER